jgi:glycosyltransferase involved in cell wall biosynthesis
LHANSRMEYEDIRVLRQRHPVAIIPNGVDVPAFVDEAVEKSGNPFARMLYLGRLHPIKGIELLFDAWRELQSQHPHWELVVAGKGEAAYVKSLRDLAKSLKLERVSFPGPIFGVDKAKMYRLSDVFVLPTKTENFGMAVAEALAHALPVITTRRAPWPGLIDHRCGWWVERSHQEMVDALDRAMGIDQQERNEMGRRGRQWMLEEFDWRSIAKRMKAVYSWLRHGGETPPWVVLD